jgi:hypothetical protein
MTTTEKLREALQAVEPGWQAADAEALRKRARRVRTKRRIAGAVAVAAVVTVVVSIVPHVFSHAGDRPVTASFAVVPDTVAEARAVVDLQPREGALPVVTVRGKSVAGAFVPFNAYRLMPSKSGAGHVCSAYSSEQCTPIRRSVDGWATDGVYETVGDDSLPSAAAYWVAEAPIARVLATVRGQPTDVSVKDMGQGYMLVSVRLPVTPDGGISADPDAVWAFDPDGRLVARHLA